MTYIFVLNFRSFYLKTRLERKIEAKFGSHAVHIIVFYFQIQRDLKMSLIHQAIAKKKREEKIEKVGQMKVIASTCFLFVCIGLGRPSYV